MFATFSIKSRLRIQSAMAIVSLVVIGGLGLFQLNAFRQDIGLEAERIAARTRELVAIEAAQVAFKTQVQEWKNILLRGHAREDFDKYLALFEKEEKNVVTLLGRLRDDPLLSKGQAAAILDTLDKHRALGVQYREALAAFPLDKPDSAHAVDRLIRGKDRPILEALDQLAHQAEAASAQESQDNIERTEATYADVRNMLIAGILAMAVVQLWLSTMTGGHIRRAVAELDSAMREIARTWDLKRRIAVSGQDEIATAAEAFNTMLDSFVQVVAQVRDGAASIGAANTRMRTLSSDLERATHLQSDSTSGIAAAIEQSSTSIAVVRDLAGEARAASQTSSALAADGVSSIENALADMRETVGLVQQTAQTIEHLGEASQQISGIVQVIKDVADQTNLLALNAAIEAARAGEQGRGFAVVADEVRRLAERTADATTEITGVTGRIQAGARASVDEMRAMVEHVSKDTSHINTAGEVIHSIRDAAEMVVRATTEISVALEEQSRAVDDIAQRVATIADTTETNAAAVRDIAAQAADLDALGAGLAESTQRFSL